MKKIFVLCLSALLLSAHIVYAQLVSDDQAVHERMERMERDLTLLQRKMYKNQQIPDTSAENQLPDPQDTAPSGSLEHLYVKMAELENNIAVLTSQVEEISHTLSQVQQDMQTTQQNMNIKLSDMDQKVASSNAPAGDLQKNDEKKTEEQETPKQLYDSAYQLLTDQQYAQAQSAFEKFLEKYPEDALAGNAQYWLGETFYVRGLYEPAAVAFANGFKTYKQSSKGADCLFKLGLTMVQLNKNKEACTAFKNVKKEFPKTTETLLQRAEKEIEKLGCSK